jgi:TldD protein
MPFATRSLRALSRTSGGDIPGALMPERTPDRELRAFAAAAVDAARTAGAAYADIRISDQPMLIASIFSSGVYAPSFDVASGFGFGIRAIVDGAMAFTYGNRPDLDLVTAMARSAVESARGLARGRALPTELTPAPVVTGEWETPMEIDPFTVPIQAHWDVLGGYMAMAERVKDGVMSRPTPSIVWDGETRVFASTEGSMLTQRFHRATFNVGVKTHYWNDFGFQSLGGAPRGAGGFELATDPRLHAHIVQRTQDAIRLASFPLTDVDVGRYNVVITGELMGTFLRTTVVPAFELDRVLGHEAGASGTSYLAPPLDVLSSSVMSPLMTLTNERDAQSDVKTAEYARWDDEGVECAPATLMKQGRVVNFLTSRTTAGALRPWYEQQGQSVVSNGNLRAGRSTDNPSSSAGHITLEAASSGPTLDDLCRDVKRGLLIYDNGYVTSDPQLQSTLNPRMTAFQIMNGRLVGCLRDGYTLQAATKQLWRRSLKALGGPATVEHARGYCSKGQPLQFNTVTTSAPAGMFADVDIIRT